MAQRGGKPSRGQLRLWHIEDEARAPGATDAELASVKRRMDKTNQRRNDLAEALDCALLSRLEAQGCLTRTLRCTPNRQG